MTGTFVLSKLQFQQNILSLKTASPVDLWMRLICRKKNKQKKKMERDLSLHKMVYTRKI